MPMNASDIHYGNYNHREKLASDGFNSSYGREVSMNQHVMSNSSSNERVPPRTLQDADQQRSFIVKDRYDSTSVENLSGKIFLPCTFVTNIICQKFIEVHELTTLLLSLHRW